MGPGRHSDSEAEFRRYEALLQMADLLVRQVGLADLFQVFGERLHQLTSFEATILSLHDPAKNVMRIHVLEGRDLVGDVDEMPLADLPSGWVWQHQQPLLLSDTELEARFPKVAQLVRQKGLRSACVLPLTTAQRRLGALGFCSIHPHAYSEHDVQFLQRAAGLVALAVQNALANSALQEERERLQMLVEVNATLVSNLDFQELFPAISGYIRKVVDQDYASVAVTKRRRSCGCMCLTTAQ